MRKLALELDALRVESFDTGAGDGRGTVRGNFLGAAGAGAIRESDPWTCAGDPESCGGSCDPSCNGSCDGAASCYGTCNRSCNGTCQGGSCDTCLFVTCGGCTSEPPEYCW